MDSQYETLLALIYEASLEPSKWRDFLECFAEATNSSGSLLFLHDFSDRSSTASPSPNNSFVAHARTDESFIESFQNHYSKVNVWLENAKQYGEGVPVVSSQLYPDTDLTKTEFYDGWLRPQGYFYSIGGAILQQSDVSVRLTALRPRSFGSYTEDETALYRRLMPHLQRSLRIHWQLVYEQEARSLREAALDQMSQAVALLNATGKVLFANQKAEAIFRQNGGPIVVSDRLTATGLQDSFSIFESLRRASMGVGCSVRLSDTGSGRQWVITFNPLPASMTITAEGCCIMAVISEPDKQEHDNLNIFAGLYQLTAAETRVLKHLLQQQSPQEIADALHVSINTVRTQLRALFAKTQTKNQRELVKFCLSHPMIN
ncbi:MAG: LuxR C-terminal-related transcriptional regulator [Methylobacter sp.]